MNPPSDDSTDRPDATFDETGRPATVRLPLFPLSSPLFPGMPLSLHIFEQRYRTLLLDRTDIDPVFGVVLMRSGREVGDRPAVVHEVGTSANLIGSQSYADGRSDIGLQGDRRFRIRETDRSGPYLIAEVEWLPEDREDGATLAELAEQTRTAMQRLVEAAAAAGNVPVPDLRLPADPTDLGFLLSHTLWLNTWERQHLLELATTRSRLERLTEIIRRERLLLTRAGASGSPIEHPGSRFLPN